MKFFNFSLNTPLLNAAGTLGFSPDLRGDVDLSALGAFVTNPISNRPRTPANGVRLLRYPGGVLLHTGLPNPGLRKVIRQHAARWARAPMPVIAHVLSESPSGVARMVEVLEEVEGVMGIELGLPPFVDAVTARELARAALGELPLIVRIPLELAFSLPETLAGVGAAAFSLGAPRGSLPASGGPVEGRLYGPGVYPLALAAVRALAPLEVPIIAGGGVYSPEDARAMLAAGAAAVQLDTVLWRGKGFEIAY